MGKGRDTRREHVVTACSFGELLMLVLHKCHEVEVLLLIGVAQFADVDGTLVYLGRVVLLWGWSSNDKVRVARTIEASCEESLQGIVRIDVAVNRGSDVVVGDGAFPCSSGIETVEPVVVHTEAVAHHDAPLAALPVHLCIYVLVRVAVGIVCHHVGGCAVSCLHAGCHVDVLMYERESELDEPVWRCAARASAGCHSVCRGIVSRHLHVGISTV